MPAGARWRRFEEERERLLLSLDQVLREQQGAVFLRHFRHVRRLARAMRARYREREQVHLRKLLTQSRVSELVETARALLLSFWLLNLCEQRHFARAHAPDARSSLAALFERLRRRGVPAARVDETLRDLRVTLVLTAHPTEAVRWSIHSSLERIDALLDRRGRGSDEDLLRELTALWQTEMLHYRDPTPLDEVRHVVHTMEHVLVPAMAALPGQLQRAFEQAFGKPPPADLRPVQLGSWVGGDRDGNPNVTAETTRAALILYRSAILERYLAEIPELVRELTLSARRVPVSAELRESVQADLAALPALGKLVERHNPAEVYRTKLNAIALRLERSLEEARAWEPAGARGGFRDAAELRAELERIERSLCENGGARLVGGRLRPLLHMADVFGMRLATLDVRQHQGRHREAREELIVPAEGPIDSLPLEHQLQFLEGLILTEGLPARALSPEATEVLETLRTVREAHERFGPDCVRDLVISDTGSEIPVLELLLLARYAGLVAVRADGGLQSTVDLVPLFESISALETAEAAMERLYGSRPYRSHLTSRGSRQQIMLGYSDSVKDGGYLAANFGLWRVQRQLAAQGLRHGVHIEFFHGRGGAIARGGGPTHRAILAQPVGSVRGRIKLTEQGEVISHKYDSVLSALYHLDQTLSAALEASLPPETQPGRGSVPEAWEATMADLAELSRKAYRGLVYDTPEFTDAFYAMTPVEEITGLRIGSRPARRAATRRIQDLRAISWTFAWNQARVLLPAWYGVGSALEPLLAIEDRRRQLRRMYQRWPFFRTALDNLQLVLAKTDLHLASIYAELAGLPAADRVLAAIEREYERCERCVLDVVEGERLLADEPELAQSLALRSPGLDALGYIQTELLRRKRRGDVQAEADALTYAIQLTINGIAAGLRNTG